MTLENLKYFLIAAEELNFTRAAKRLYITQQSLSSHIAKIEDYYGCKLFDRSAPMSLTAEGAALTERLNQLLNFSDDIEREMKDMTDFKTSALSVGITRVRGAIYLTPVLTKFHKKYPNIHIKIFEGSAPDVEDILHRAQIDLSIGGRPKIDYDVTSIPFWEEGVVAVVPQAIMQEQLSAHAQRLAALSRSGEPFDWRVFKDCPFLALNQQHQSGVPFYKICKELGFAPDIVLESESVDTLLRLCIDGMGILVCPDIFLYPYRRLYQQGERSVYTFPWKNGLSREICVNYLKNKYLSKAAKEFMDMILGERYLA